MKLSEKGIETIFSALLKTIEERDLVFRQISQGVFKKHIEALEFGAKDFEGAVVLTVEEAKVIEELALLCLFLRPNDATIEKAKIMQKLNYRIKQAEGK